MKCLCFSVTPFFKHKLSLNAMINICIPLQRPQGASDRLERIFWEKLEGHCGFTKYVYVSLNISFRESLQNWYKRSLGLKDKIRFWCLDVKGQGQSDLTFLSMWYIRTACREFNYIWPTCSLGLTDKLIRFWWSKSRWPQIKMFLTSWMWYLKTVTWTQRWGNSISVVNTWQDTESRLLLQHIYTATGVSTVSQNNSLEMARVQCSRVYSFTRWLWNPAEDLGPNPPLICSSLSLLLPVQPIRRWISPPPFQFKITDSSRT